MCCAKRSSTAEGGSISAPITPSVRRSGVCAQGSCARSHACTRSERSALTLLPSYSLPAPS